MSLASFSSFTAPQIGFGYSSVMKKVATAHHVHCAYGGEELNSKNPGTAEHVQCHSAGGPNTDSNFLPVCQKHNGERASIALPKFLATHPKAWENIKQSILELNGIKDNGFDGHKWAQSIVNTVEKQSGKHMDINLDESYVASANDDEDEDSEIENTVAPERGYTPRKNRTENSDSEMDKTLTTRSGHKIYVGERKPMNFYA